MEKEIERVCICTAVTRMFGLTCGPACGFDSEKHNRSEKNE